MNYQSKAGHISNDWYKALFDFATDAIFVYTRNQDGSPTRFIDVNQAACDLLGYTNEELLTLSILDITPKDQLTQKAELREKLELDQHVVFESVRIAKDGENIPVENHARSIDIDGVPYFFMITRDIRQRKQDEKEKEEAENKARNMEKLAFVGEIMSGIAHDLRNPLNVINNAVNLIETVTDNDKSGDHMDKLVGLMKMGTDKSTRVIDDLMDFVRGTHVNLKPVQINEEIDEIVNAIKVPDNVQIVVNNMEAIAKLPTIMIDAAKLDRVFYNLINNAAQAMPYGGTITIAPTTSKGYLRIDIIDTGTGIPEERIAKIFDPLFTSKLETGGTGLGLAVCKTIIEAHNGTIEVASKVDEGAKFTIQIPLSIE